jgi:SAM-dependent methyltransferase
VSSEDGYFGEDVAASYDLNHGGSDTEHVQTMVSVLQELAFGGNVLEFAIGTGRVALPLQERGVHVKGIELSRPMVAELKKKNGGSSIDVVIGDIASTRIAGEFSLIFLVYNTIDNLTSQDAQVACFENAFSHLAPGGRFVIETLVPPIQKIPFGETTLAFDCSVEHFGIDEFDIVSQQYTSHHLNYVEGGYRRRSVPFRYAWPAELDLMARCAGFTLEHRWSDWRKSQFTSISRSHISVWQRPETVQD